MSILLDTRPDVRNTSGDNETECYFCCCSPNVALCGRDLTGEEPCEADCGHPDCEACVALIEVRCILCGLDLDDPCYCGRGC